MASITVFAPDDAFAEFSFASDSLKLEHVLIPNSESDDGKNLKTESVLSESVEKDDSIDNTKLHKENFAVCEQSKKNK